MLNRFFQKMSGVRCSSIHYYNNKVEILSWHHPAFTPAQHLALKVTYKGDEYYLSFSPKSLIGLSKRPFLKLREGVEGFFVNSYEDELLIQGFRNEWPGIKSELNIEQLRLLRKGTIKKVSDAEILNITNYFSDEKKEQLRKMGAPSEKIILYTLDFDAIIKKIEFYQQESTCITWASWCGTYFRQNNTHNCSSIVLDALYAGGMGTLVTSNNDLLGIAGLLLGSTYALIAQPVWHEALTKIILGILMGRGIGGLYEGYNGIQSFLNLLSSQGKDNLGSTLGLRMVSTIFSTFIGVLKVGSVTPAFLTIPRDVLDLAHQAKTEEESVSIYKLEMLEEKSRHTEYKNFAYRV